MVAPTTNETEDLLKTTPSKGDVKAEMQESKDDPATTPAAPPTTSDFPPCTADQCHVDEQEKKAATSKARPSCEMTEKCVNACAAYGKVCPCAARIASHAACDAMQELQKDSKVFAAGKPDFTYWNADDIQIGKKLGEGGFSHVNECTVTVPNHPDSNQELAIKYLKRRAMVDLHHFKHGAADLAVEAYFLQTLRHDNIVQLHGITAGSVETNVATGKECGFFIVVDRLYDTLEHKLEVWRKAEHEEQKNSTFLQRRSAEYKEAKRADLMERCRIAVSIAQAMQYLHSLDIVFRDLKPDNIGFDKDGTLKLFDFGLAKELKHARDDGTYNLTGHTGSRRYMAPEVALELPYNLSVDVYSFGILLWELCAAAKPFYGYSSNKHMQLVVLGHERPKMDAAHTQYWPAPLQNLMKRCWARDPKQRPDFDKIIEILQVKVLGIDSKNSDSSQASLGMEEAVSDRPAVEEKPRAFPRLFPAKRQGRATTVDVVPPPPSDGFKSMKPAAKPTTRARSWGLGGRRSQT